MIKNRNGKKMSEREMSKYFVELEKEIMGKNTFALHNGVEITYVGNDCAEGRLTLTEKSMNPYGIAHGGVYFTLADVTAAFAARSDGKMYVTNQGNMYFLKATKAGVLHSKAKVVKRGKSICVVESRIYDEKERIVFDSTFSLFCLDNK